MIPQASLQCFVSLRLSIVGGRSNCSDTSVSVDDSQELDQLYDDLLTMETLVYECSVDSNFTFSQLQEMSNIERIHLMMSKVG